MLPELSRVAPQVGPTDSRGAERLHRHFGVFRTGWNIKLRHVWRPSLLGHMKKAAPRSRLPDNCEILWPRTTHVYIHLFLGSLSNQIVMASNPIMTYILDWQRVTQYVDACSCILRGKPWRIVLILRRSIRLNSLDCVRNLLQVAFL